MRASRRIVFATFGSLGDLHPYIALALELGRRGHRPCIVTTDYHREAVERTGIDFAPMRPSAADMGDPAALVRRLFDPVKGPAYLIRDLVMPHLRGAYEDLDRACAGTDVLVSHPLTFAARLVAEKRGLAWRSTVLAPLSLMSAIDPPLFGPAPWLLRIRALGWKPYRAAFGLVKHLVRGWEKPLRALRADLGLPPMRGYAQFEGQYAPQGTLALFSSVLAEPQADWPPRTVVCGFSRYDGPPAEPALKAELDAFLAAGPPPVVFTLGSSVSMVATSFFDNAIEAARRLTHRALLVTGQDPSQYDAAIASAGLAPGTIKVMRYLPYSEAFPHAAVNVHQGGVGTLAQGLAAGRPQLITPVGFDQPDNARRVERLGLSKSIAFEKVTSDALTEALRGLLTAPHFASNAAAAARAVNAEERAQRAAAMLGGLDPPSIV